MIKYLTDEKELETALQNEFLIVDFYADWCGPCRMLTKVLEQVDFSDILKVNIDKFGELAQKFDIMSIPTICIFKKGKLVKQHTGFLNLADLKKLVMTIKK